MAFVLKSPAFSHGEDMPSRYTCEGENISPPLEWADAPAETRSFALFMEDMDAPKGVFRHWALYDIMPDRVLLPEGVGHGVKTESMGHGVNDYGHPRYDGPCPPESDGTHLYRFRLVALSVETPINLPKEPAVDLWDVVQPFILAQTELIGAYASRHLDT